ncbi:hypothetical protein SAMN00777080_1527 [Aquiflexum balticum DSM 16537]|uniref:Catalase n=1 Tax=Aquiflexum balticum DSM 16537 TaxID=758820 RepID=A0A1W2H3A8_9BACT|nr:catalase [Aquiflexum balticum]SMD42956.1 hypothetical protein SAMN00777080_1527 [Aquiflexum balticum DSM 16537]
MNNSIDEKEEKEIQEIIQTMKRFLSDTYPKGNIKRNFHPKMHGCLKGTLEIRNDLPDTLKQGLFKSPNTYEVWLRFSNAPPKIQSDKSSSGRGLAIKVLNVPGTVIEEDPIGVNCQNFLMTTSPILSAGSIRLYNKAIKAILFGWKRQLVFALNPLHWRSLFLTLKHSKKHDNLLAQKYFSGGAFRFGPDQFVKFVLEPHNSNLGYTLGKPKTDNFLREQLKADLKSCQHGFTIYVQVHENDKTEPLEDTSVEWKKEGVPVADLWIPAQDFDFEERNKFGEALSFSPWACLEDHEPIGGINRARRLVYKELAELRKTENSV